MRSPGCDFVAIQRDSDFYPAASTRDRALVRCHVVGLEMLPLSSDSPIVSRNISSDLVMTACTTDWIFKGYGLEKSYRSVFGRYLPFLVYTNERVDGFLPNTPFAGAASICRGPYRNECPRGLV